MTKLLTTFEFANQLGVSERHVRRLIASGRLAAVRVHRSGLGRHEVYRIPSDASLQPIVKGNRYAGKK